MQCPVCLTEFANYDSYRVHNWRFHNPDTKYRSKATVSKSWQTPPTPEQRSYHSLSAPVVAASIGIAAVSGGNWKRWLIALLIIVCIVFLVWYFAIRESDREEDQVAG